MKLKRWGNNLAWIGQYKRDYVSGDVSAGLTVGVMLIPQSMAYALIAGLPPVYGLYAAIFPQVVYAFLGTSRQLAVAPVAMDSLLVAAGISVMATAGSQDYISLAVLLALLVGLFQFLLGIVRAGFVTNLLSKPVISGFTSAAAIIIALNQAKHLLGYDIEKSANAFLLFRNVILDISDIHGLTAGLGLLSFFIIRISKRLAPRIPGSLSAVILGIMITYTLGLEDLGIDIVGHIPKGLPGLILPEFDGNTMIALVPLALTIALVAFMEAFSVAKAIESKDKETRIRPNQELIALGLSNFVGSLFQAFPVSGGFSRTAVNFQSGAKTQLSSLVSAAVVVLTLLFLTPFFYFLPKAVLGAVILAAVTNLIDFRYASYLFQANRIEFAILLTTFLVTLIFSMVPGIIAGVCCSIIYLLFRLSIPHMATLGRLPGHHEFRNINRFKELEVWEELVLIRLDAPLNFVNIQFFKDYISRTVAKASKKVEGIALDASPMGYIDSSGMQGLREVIAFLADRQIAFYMAGAKGPVRDQMHRTGLMNYLGKESVFLDLNEVVEYHVNKTERKYEKEATQTGR